MGVAFFWGSLIFFLIYFFLCVALFLGGLLPLLYNNNRKHQGKKSIRILSVLAILPLILGSVGFCAPQTALAVGVLDAMILPSEYTDTGIAVERLDTDHFTADGVDYQTLNQDFLPMEKGDALYHYRHPDWAGLSKNYYPVQNSQFGLLIDNNGRVYCPVDDWDAANAYYNDPKNGCWSLPTEDGFIALPAEDDAVIQAYAADEWSHSQYESLTKDEMDAAKRIKLYCLSDDGAVMIDTAAIVQWGGRYYTSPDGGPYANQPATVHPVAKKFTEDFDAFFEKYDVK